MMGIRSKHFNFKIALIGKAFHFSLEKSESDRLMNQMSLNAVVGTLVKYGTSGRLEPYLAESWTVSSDKKNWKFKIRKGLFCEDGTLITPDLLLRNLTKSLKEYSKKGSTIMFDYLLGWEDFTQGKKDILRGLAANDDTLEFSFSKNPDDLLDLLRMPYFGLWLEKNGKMISSGAYAVESFSDSLIKLKLRKEWFTVSPESFETVDVSFFDINDLNNDKSVSRTIVRLPPSLKHESSESKRFLVTGAPTILESIVLSPFKNSFFNNIENRHVFRNRVKLLYPDVVKSNSFYFTAETKGLNNSVISYSKEVKKKDHLMISLERVSFTNEDIERIKKIISFALEGSGQSFELVKRTSDDKDWYKKIQSNAFFDARISGVDIGAYPMYMAIKMIFCTKLGVTYPDPTGEICKIVNDGIDTVSEIDQKFIDKFNNTIHQDAIVIPLLHQSDKWLVSDDLDPHSLPHTTLYPQFELIRLR